MTTTGELAAHPHAAISEGASNVSGLPTAADAHLISHLTDLCRVFLFSYCPRRRMLVSWSKNAGAILGVKDSAISRDGNLFLRHVHPDDRFLLLSDLEHALNGEEAYQATYRWIRPDTNELRWLHCRGSSICHDQDEYFEGMIVDLTAELTGTILQVAGPDSIATVIGSFPLLVCTLDTDLRLVRVNRPDQLTFDFGDPTFRPENFRVGRPFLEGFGDTGLRQRYEGILWSICRGTCQHHSDRISSNARSFNLEILPLCAGSEVTGVLITARDVSDTVALEQRLSALERAQGVATIAKSVAHNVNNSLQAVIGHAALIRAHPDRAELIATASQEIIDIVQRTSDLTRELWSFDSGGAPAPFEDECDCNTAILSAIKCCQSIFELGIEVDLALGTAHPIWGSFHQVQGIVQKVLATTISIAGIRGRICLRSTDRHLDDGEVAGLAAGDFTVVTIATPGCRDGVAKTQLELLASARTEAEHIGGKVVLEASDPPGMSLSIYFPECVPAASGPNQAATIRRQTVEPVGPSVLLVDDDSIVRSTIAAMLQAAGIKTVEATSGAGAIEVLRANRHDIGMVLLDALMPGLDGASTARAIVREWPGLPILGFSGASAPTIGALKAAGVSDVIRKPVDPVVLTEVIRRYMPRAASATSPLAGDQGYDAA